jgi:hypothetical protein
MSIDYRSRAKHHHIRALNLAAGGELESLRYASLELRLCIECLIYDRLQAYLPEVSHAAIKKWTPKQVMAELLAADPKADRS